MFFFNLKINYQNYLYLMLELIKNSFDYNYIEKIFIDYNKLNFKNKYNHKRKHRLYWKRI